jgi:hypothetical protein
MARETKEVMVMALSKKEIERADYLQARQEKRSTDWNAAVAALTDDELESMSDNEIRDLAGAESSEARREDAELEELFEKGYMPKMNPSYEQFWFDPLHRDE